MKKIFLILLISFQTVSTAQKEIVGKVEFYKSIESDWIFLKSFSDATIKSLSNRIHKIKVEQNNNIVELQTDSTGTFRMKTKSNDSLRITVNDHSPIFNQKFQFDVGQINDTVKLRISDKRLLIHRDSINEPKFFKLYSEKQAELDFKNGKLQLLAIAVDWSSDESIKRRKRIEIEYGIEYDYFFQPTREKIRIMYRYNQVMKRLVGINKNVW